MMSPEIYLIKQSTLLPIIKSIHAIISHIAFENASGDFFQVFAIQFEISQFRHVSFSLLFRQLDAACLRQHDQFIGILALQGFYDHFFCQFISVDRHNNYHLSQNNIQSAYIIYFKRKTKCKQPLFLLKSHCYHSFRFLSFQFPQQEYSSLSGYACMKRHEYLTTGAFLCKIIIG